MIKRPTTFCIQVPVDDPVKMQEFNKVMDEVHDANTQAIEDIAEEFGVDFQWAMDVWYLRTRSRWTEEVECELIRMAKAGEPRININEWP